MKEKYKNLPLRSGVGIVVLNKENKGWLFWKANIFNKPFLINKEGRYKGYPFRSFAGGKFLGGYSDHFPVYLYLFRELN